MSPGRKKPGKIIIKRREKRILGIFIDGIGLDRATRRLQHKVSMSSLVQALSTGTTLAICRYYTVIPYEDDSRQLAFLDAVSRAGLTVIVKRLPPKGIVRQVTADVEMSSDIVAFAMGRESFSEEYVYRPAEHLTKPRVLPLVSSRRLSELPPSTEKEEGESEEKIKRIVTVVCPDQEMAYPISLANEIGVDTVTADFANPKARNLMKSSAKWIDLSTSESIWRD